MGHSEEQGPSYLGARITDEKRLVLVPLDPDRPWTAFKRMRAWMKRSHAHPDGAVDVFTAPETPDEPESQYAPPADAGSD